QPPARYNLTLPLFCAGESVCFRVALMPTLRADAICLFGRAAALAGNAPRQRCSRHEGEWHRQAVSGRPWLDSQCRCLALAVTPRSPAVPLELYDLRGQRGCLVLASL